MSEPIPPKVIVLDHEEGIVIDPAAPPFANYHALHQSVDGLRTLAGAVRQLEQQVVDEDEYAEFVVMRAAWHEPPILACSFNWFSVTIVSYLRLVALVQLMTRKGWTSAALTEKENGQRIREHCGAYVKRAIPGIVRWRNKVAAHFAATAPYVEDTIGTLGASIMNPITYSYPFFSVGVMQWHGEFGDRSDLPRWSLTETFQLLAPRYWPEVCPLPEIVRRTPAGLNVPAGNEENGAADPAET